ncbi:MAG: glycosyltransferase family 2 protein [Saprospiraceae bacterium]|nr:glycosyltransferase family 2 protein [Saprospiraceae bacterium]
MPQTALVILNYNGKSYLERFLPSILKYTPREVTVVLGDNHSKDDSVVYVQNEYPAIEIICNDQNYGFARGYNEILKRVTADYYFLLNSDVELRGSWSSLIKAMDDDPQLAACQPKILSYHQPNLFEHAGAAGGWIDFLGYPFCKGRLLNLFEEDHQQYDQPAEIFWASGAAMMVRARLFHQLGGFDDDFFAHMEEIDWCWRAKKCAWKIKSIPDAVIYHIGGGTLPYTSNNKIFLNFRNNLATLLKNETAARLMVILPLRWLLDGTALINFLIRGNLGGANAVFKAYLHFINWVPRLVKKRKSFRELSKGHIMNRAGVFRGSLIFSFFILGKKTFKTLVNE